LNAPKTVWGSADHSAYLQHGGTGLSRNADYPCKDIALPGGILDSQGQHIEILNIDAQEGKPHAIAGFLLGAFSLLCTYQYRFSFGRPEQLNLEDFKDRIIKFGKEERKMPRPTKKILASKTFYEVMEAECEPEIVKAYYGMTVVKNWIDEPKRRG
jgi:hypothetical protein